MNLPQAGTKALPARLNSNPAPPPKPLGRAQGPALCAEEIIPSSIVPLTRKTPALASGQQHLPARNSSRAYQPSRKFRCSYPNPMRLSLGYSSLGQSSFMDRPRFLEFSKQFCLATSLAASLLCFCCSDCFETRAGSQTYVALFTVHGRRCLWRGFLSSRVDMNGRDGVGCFRLVNCPTERYSGVRGDWYL